MSTGTSDSTKVEGGGESGSPSLEQTRRDLEEQFNVQRARMKELFLQKEEDMQGMLLEKEQLQSEVLGLRAEVDQLQILSANQQSEIQNLQLLVSETVEASSSGSEEVRRLRARNMELEQQLGQLKQQLSQQEVSLAPATFVRSLARKLGADSDDQQPQRKNVEEGELLASLIEPLDTEITALKNKLRDTDAQLQEALKARVVSTSVSSGGDSKPEGESRVCDMCANYEKQLVGEQAQADAARDRAHRLDTALRMATEELEGVRSLHDETVRAWHSERAASAEQLDKLQAAVKDARSTLTARAADAEAASRRALDHVTTLTVDREMLQKKLDTLERDNAVLVGQYTKRAAEMQNELIDLPDTVEALQEHLLQVREQLIECAVGRERALQAEGELREQLLQRASAQDHLELQLGAARGQLARTREELEQLQAERSQITELGDKLRHSSDMIEQLLQDKERLQREVCELRTRVGSLQQELDNSEKVQRDFVRLSQTLQVELQHIREADTEVRWQHDEDVNECPSCRTPLPNSKKKVHCRHCGRIFCAGCASHSVPSGPRGQPARVCSVCRTLLQPHSAPYFSTHPPHSPD